MNKGRILVVEDDMENYQLVLFTQGRAGYNVLLAVNSFDGVAGRQTTKSQQAMKSIPFFALTVHTLPGERKRAMRQGVTVISPNPSVWEVSWP